MAKPFSKLSEQETLALAIALEEEDSRIYADFAERFRKDFPDTAATLTTMQHEESQHSRKLMDEYRVRFGEHIPQIHRSDVTGLVKRRPVWLMRTLSVAQARRQVGLMELESRRFYEAAAARTGDAGTRTLLAELALAEADHSAMAQRLESEQIASGARAREDESQRRMLVLQIVQQQHSSGGHSRPRGARGRLSLHTCAAVCGGLRHPQQPRCISCGAGRLGGGRDQHGIRGGPTFPT